MHDTTKTRSHLSIGQPVYWQDEGWIAEISDNESGGHVIGGGGLVSAGRTLRIVWRNNTTCDVPEAIAARWIDMARDYGLAIINDAPERYQAAIQSETKLREKRLADANAARLADRQWRDDHAGKIPADARAVIVAEFHRDKCDSMSDYFATEREKSIVLAFSKHTRDLFPEMRKAALNHPETAFLHDAPESAENRQKYSMGGGYFLSEAGSYRTGWRIKKIPFGRVPVDSVPVGEWAIPEAIARLSPAPAQSSTGLAIEKHTHTKKNFDMWIVTMGERVERDTFDTMLSEAKARGGWYSRAWAGTPGGFAFKSEDAATEFTSLYSGDSDGSETPAKASPVATNSGTADRLRALADSLQSEIDNKRADRRENTPKQRREAAKARNDALHLERAQAGLRALAELHEAGTVPDVLRRVTTKKAALELASAKIDHSGSYYDAGRDTGQPYRDTPEALAFWGLLRPRSEAERRADEIKSAESELRNCKIPGFFPTPSALVARMIDHAGDLSGLDVLEPEAGSGAILDAIRDTAPDARLTAYEIAPRLRELLTLKSHALAGWDFTEAEPGPHFDRVLMNPPFENGQDCDHVRHAFEMLRPGGRLVAIMSPAFTYSTRGKAQAFREWLAGQVSEVHEIEAGAFKESGTGVATVLVVIDREG